MEESLSVGKEIGMREQEREEKDKMAGKIDSAQHVIE